METNRKKQKPKQKTIDNVIHFYNEFRNHLLNNKGNISSAELVKLYKKYSVSSKTLECLINLKCVTKIAPSTYDFNLIFMPDKTALKVVRMRNKMQKDYLEKKKKDEPVKKSKPVKIRTEPRTYIKKNKPSLFRRFLNFIFGK